MQYCNDWSGDPVAASATSIELSCETTGGAFAAVPCDRTGALGGCQATAGAGSFSVTATSWWFKDNTGMLVTADDLKKLCANSKSSFVAP
jgi:hypothetical protein